MNFSEVWNPSTPDRTAHEFIPLLSLLSIVFCIVNPLRLSYIQSTERSLQAILYFRKSAIKESVYSQFCV
jgi:hypothetical protein